MKSLFVIFILLAATNLFAIDQKEIEVVAQQNQVEILKFEDQSEKIVLEAKTNSWKNISVFLENLKQKYGNEVNFDNMPGDKSSKAKFFKVTIKSQK